MVVCNFHQKMHIYLIESCFNNLVQNSKAFILFFVCCRNAQSTLELPSTRCEGDLLLTHGHLVSDVTHPVAPEAFRIQRDAMLHAAKVVRLFLSPLGKIEFLRRRLLKLYSVTEAAINFWQGNILMGDYNWGGQILPKAPLHGILSNPSNRSSNGINITQF